MDRYVELARPTTATLLLDALFGRVRGALPRWAGSFVILALLLPGVGWAGGVDCASVEQVEITGREFVNAGVGYQKLKSNLIDSLLKQAVEQVLGKQITANSRSELAVRNQDLEESLRTMTVERARGFVTGYEVRPPGEELLELGGATIMQMTLTADVCIPDSRGATYIVAIGEILSGDGSPAPPAIVETLVAEITKNPRLSTVRLPVESHIYYDFLLTGRVTRAEKKEVANLGGQIGAALLNSLTNEKQRVDDRVLQLTVEFALQLEDVADRTTTNAIGRGIETMPRRSNRNVEAMTALKAASKAAVDALGGVMENI
jgi:hypothetical protein